jgi:hypothetical protein
MVHIA